MADFRLASLVDKGSTPSISTVRTWVQGLTDGKSDREWVHVTLDELGNLPDVPQALGRRREESLQVCLHLMPGQGLLRRLSVGTLSPKDIEPALELWAEESLPLPIEEYYLDSWNIPTDMRGLVALPREPLSRARQQLVAAQAQLTVVRVPELRPPIDARSGVILWETPVGLLVCLWQHHSLYDWQSFLNGQSTRAIAEQMAACCREVPAFVYVNGSGSEIIQIRSELESMWPHVECTETGGLDGPITDRHYLPGPAIASFLEEEQQQAATVTEKFHLGLALTGVLIAALFLFFANVTYLQQQVEAQQHHMSLLKIRANRSEKVAARIGDTMRKVRELRTMTTERQGLLQVLKELSEALPSRVKLDNFTVERDGTTAMDGMAETELDISAMLERFRRSSLFREPNLTYIQKDTKRDKTQALIRFRLETRLAQPLLNLPSEEDHDAGGKSN